MAEEGLQLVPEYPSADGVEEEVDGETGNVQRPGVIPEDLKIRPVDVDEPGQDELIQDEVDQRRNVEQDVAGGDENKYDRQLNVLFVLPHRPLLLYRQVVVVVEGSSRDGTASVGVSPVLVDRHRRRRRCRLRQGQLPSLPLGLRQPRHSDDDEDVQDGNDDDGNHTEHRHLDDVQNGKDVFVFDADAADVVVVDDPDADGVVRGDAGADHDQQGEARRAGTTDSEQLLELDRQEHRYRSLDGEEQDQTGRVVGEQVAQVLEQYARRGTAVDDVRRYGREVPAAHRRQRTRREDADQVDGIGGGERQQVDVRGRRLHLLRRENDDADGVARQADDHAGDRGEEEDAQGQKDPGVVRSAEVAQVEDRR